MITPSASIALGFAFVLLGGINVWLVLEAWSRVKTANVSSRMLALHRIGGYLFIALFCVMTYYMLARLGSGGDNSATVTLHMALAMILSPLLFIKVLVARYYKNQHNLLMPLGLTIFVLSFVLIASTAGPYLTRPSKIERVSINSATQFQPITIDMNLARDLMQKRCSKCHNLDRVVGARKGRSGMAGDCQSYAHDPRRGHIRDGCPDDRWLPGGAESFPRFRNRGADGSGAGACGSALRALPHSGSRI
jgi:hypothetical protein